MCFFSPIPAYFRQNLLLTLAALSLSVPFHDVGQSDREQKIKKKRAGSPALINLNRTFF